MDENTQIQTQINEKINGVRFELKDLSKRDEDKVDLEELMKEFSANTDYDEMNGQLLHSIYSELTLKDLITICNFYELDKFTKGFRKNDYINLLVTFEISPENYEIVERRQRYWTYIEELKNDPIMKKYIIFDLL